MNKANPIPLGLLGYGMSTVLLSFANMGKYPLGGMVFTMAIFFGGIAQVIVSIMLYSKGDSFGTTAFGGYGCLWLSFAFMNIGGAHGWWSVSGKDVGYYLLLWAVFTIGLAWASTVAPSVLTIILLLTIVLLGSLGLGAINGNASLSKFGGYEGVLTGALAIYLAFAFLINEMHGNSKLPIGKPFRS
jgi:succinate-acetate transporter protein